MSNLRQVRCVLAVRDLAESVRFYCDKLGFVIDFEVEGWCFLSRDQFRLMLGHCADEVPASRLNNHSYFAYVLVDSIDELNREFRGRGLIHLKEPEDKPWGLREFLVTTVDGHRIMFGQEI